MVTATQIEKLEKKISFEKGYQRGYKDATKYALKQIKAKKFWK